MALRAELEIVGASLGAPRLVVGPTACVIGRSASCDYVVDRDTISREHATIWVEDGRAMVRDLRSRNGTFVNDQRVDVVELAHDDVLRFGSAVAFRVHLVAQAFDAPVSKRLAVEDVATQHRFPLGPVPVRIGTAPECAVRLAEGPDVAGAFVSPVEGEAWFGSDDDMEELRVGAEVVVAGHTFRVVEIVVDPGATMAEGAAPWPYRVRASLDAEGGPKAVVEEAPMGRRHAFVGTNRAVLLFLLARRWEADRSASVEVDEVGWCADDDLAVGLWGREGVGRPIKVLVCRLRAELREAGFDPWFVEKRRGALRLRVLEAAVD